MNWDVEQCLGYSSEAEALLFPVLISLLSLVLPFGGRSLRKIRSDGLLSRKYR